MLFIFGFGWAKPVPVNPYYFEGDRRKGMMTVSFAGPASNLLLAFILIAIYTIGHFGTLSYAYSVTGLILYRAITLNVYLAIFNLIPIPPLDGSKILAGVLPQANSLQIFDYSGAVWLFDPDGAGLFPHHRYHLGPYC